MSNAQKYWETQIMKDINGMRNPHQMMQGMGGMGAPPDFGKMLKQGPGIIKRIKKKEPSLCSDLFKMEAVQFMVQYYTTRMLAMASPDGQMPGMGMGMPGMPPQQAPKEPDPEQLEAFKADQARDMEHAWKILTSKYSSQELKVNASLLRIEIAQRLEDCEKLTVAVDTIVKTGNPMMDMRTNMVAFTAVPLIGRWKTFVEMGNKMAPQALQEYSMISEQMPVPDYAVLYELCKEENAISRPDADPNALKWSTQYVSSIKVKFRELSCGDFEEKKKELLKEIEQDPNNLDWEEVPNPNNVSLRRMGGIYQALSFSEQPQQLVGIHEPDRLRLKGRTRAMMGPPDIDPQLIMSGQVQLDPSQIQVIIQEEDWDLQKDESEDNLYKGTYKMHNYQPTKKGEKITDPEKAPLHMTFDVEFRFCSQEEYQQLKTTGKIVTESKLQEEIEKIVTDFDELELD